MQYKYKVGDRVAAGGNNVHAPKYVGKEGHIVAVPERGCAHPYLVRFSDSVGLWCNCEHKADERRFITIEYGEDKPTVARMFENDKVIKTAESRCNPSDEYDAKTGIALAVERLFERKVFSIKAWMKALEECPDTIVLSIESGWPQKLEGKTPEECKAMGCAVADSWLVDKE